MRKINDRFHMQHNNARCSQTIFYLRLKKNTRQEVFASERPAWSSFSMKRGAIRLSHWSKRYPLVDDCAAFNKFLLWCVIAMEHFYILPTPSLASEVLSVYIQIKWIDWRPIIVFILMQQLFAFIFNQLFIRL